jgi:hypothetical protein
MDESLKLLGFSTARIYEWRRIAKLPEESKEPIRQRKIAGRAALDAQRIGGDEAIKTAVEKGFSHHTV